MNTNKPLLVLIAFMVVLPVLPVRAQTGSLPDIGIYSVDARSARLVSLRAQYRISLSDKEKELVSTRCEQAQISLQKLATRLAETRLARVTTYKQVIASLNNLRTLVVARQVDTSNIELLTVEYQLKKSEFETNVTDYQIALDDSIQVDCRSQPEDFRAALEGVRSARKTVVNTSTQIEELTKSNLRTAFDALKLKLQAEGNDLGGK